MKELFITVLLVDILWSFDYLQISFRISVIMLIKELFLGKLMSRDNQRLY